MLRKESRCGAIEQRGGRVGERKKGGIGGRDVWMDRKMETY